VTPSSNVRVSSDQFLELVERSQLVPQDAVRRVCASLRDSLTGRVPDDPHQVAAAFVEANLLTEWQANMLLRGKHKGFQLGKYRLLGEIGSGGMSRVYLGEHTLMRRRVAIKVLPPARVGDSSYLARFRREAEAIAQLDHPNIVRAFDIDHEGRTHYFVMEYIDGQDFLQIVKDEGPLEYRRAAEYIAQVADALHHAHHAGLIHRDIKPGNCIVERGGTVKLLDLGLAKFVQDTGPSLTLLHEENVLGTADYLAPEQARNSHTVDHRADIYSLGCTLYFLLTGHAPFPTGSLSERLIKHQREEPQDIRIDRPDVPQQLVQICGQMMRKSPDKRIQDGGEVARQLRAWREGTSAQDQSRGGPFGDVWRRAALQSGPTSGGTLQAADRPAKPRTAARAAPNGKTDRQVSAKPPNPAETGKESSNRTRVPMRGESPPRAVVPAAVNSASSERDRSEPPSLPSLSSINLGEQHAWEAGSHFLPRRYALGDRKATWIWVGAVLSVGLLAILTAVLFLAR
jgi:serine/threonine protein kinase